MLRFVYAALCLGLILGLAAPALAEDKPKEKDAKEKTLKGTITCGKCDLGESKTCATVVKVKEGDKDVIYWFDKTSSGKYHKEICKEGKEGTVVGTVSKDGDKWIIKATKVEFK